MRLGWTRCARPTLTMIKHDCFYRYFSYGRVWVLTVASHLRGKLASHSFPLLIFTLLSMVARAGDTLVGVVHYLLEAGG
jgi:hypothetical protein